MESRTLANDMSELSGLAELISEGAAKMGAPERCVFELTLALEEVFTNIVKYAYEDAAPHRIRVELGPTDPDTLLIRFEDDGRPFDPTRAADPDLSLPVEERPVGKLGIFLVKKIMDSVTYERVEGKNILTLLKKVRPEACIIG